MTRRQALAVSLAAAAPAAAAPNARAEDRVARPREVPGAFTRVRVGGPFDVTVREGSPAAVVVEATPADQEKVKVEVRGDALVVGTPVRLKLAHPGYGRDVVLLAACRRPADQSRDATH